MTITIEVEINKPVAEVWKKWITPEDITQWNFASDDWHCPSANNDFKVGGKLNSRMEAKDGSFGFDFWGVYSHILPHKLIELTLGDDRKVKTEFIEGKTSTKVVESFETEDENSAEMQRQGWQAILNNFKKHCEKN